MERIKSEFADQFTRCLQAFYKGRLPSFAKIARDFSLRAPHLPHVSAETVRHWVRGASLPHVSRMQVLVDWLGPEVAATFDNTSRVLLTAAPKPNSNHLYTQSEQIAALHTSHHGNGKSTHHDLVDVLDRLTEQERQAVLEIAKLIVDRHHQPTTGNGELLSHIQESNGSAKQEPDS